MRPNQTYKLLHSKGNHQQDEKAAYEVGENITNHISDEQLISKKCKEFIQLKKI